MRIVLPFAHPRTQGRGRMMEFCDFTHDRQPQAAAVDSGAFDAIKSVKHLERIFLAETYSIVFYFQQRKIPLLPQARCNVPALRGIAQSVIEKVVDHFPQQGGLPRTEKTNHRHLTDPLPEKMVDLFIDYRMMGVGGDDSWGEVW